MHFRSCTTRLHAQRTSRIWRKDVICAALALHAGLLFWAAATPLDLPEVRPSGGITELVLVYLPQPAAQESRILPDSAKPAELPVVNADSSPATPVEPVVIAEPLTQPVAPATDVVLAQVVHPQSAPAPEALDAAAAILEPDAAPAPGTLSNIGTQPTARDSAGTLDVAATSPLRPAPTTGTRTVVGQGGASLSGAPPTSVAASVDAAATTHRAAFVCAELLQQKQATRKFARAAGQHGWRGLVVVLAALDASGIPVSCSIEQSSGNAAHDAAALEAVRGFRFSPALQGGTPVPSRLLVPLQL